MLVSSHSFYSLELLVFVKERLSALSGLIAHKLKEKKVEIGKIRRLSYVGIYYEGCHGKFQQN